MDKPKVLAELAMMQYYVSTIQSEVMKESPSGDVIYSNLINICNSMGASARASTSELTNQQFMKFLMLPTA